MTHIMQILVIVIAGACVAVADVFIKRAAVNTNTISEALKHPIIIPAVFLYICQIVLFAYVFVRRWELGIVGILQMACYAIIVIVSGIVFFHEKITITEGIGMVLALIGIFLMNA